MSVSEQPEKTQDPIPEPIKRKRARRRSSKTPLEEVLSEPKPSIDSMPLTSFTEYRKYNEEARRLNKKLGVLRYKIKQCPVDLHPSQRVIFQRNQKRTGDQKVHLSNHLIHFDKYLTPGKIYDLPECIIHHIESKGEAQWEKYTKPDGSENTRKAGSLPRFSLRTVFSGEMQMTRYASDVLSIMRRALGRRNENDPDASDDILLNYLNDFISITMPNEAKLFENFGTLSFTIDESSTTGVYDINALGSSGILINLSLEAFISVVDPIGSSISWNSISIYQDPESFFSLWGINNDDILIPGYPTQVLFYGNELTFRTIPDKPYIVKIYGYKINSELLTGNTEIPYDYWLRYLAYGACVNYSNDFRFSPEIKSGIDKAFSHERKLMLTRTHNQRKLSRSLPRF